MVICDKDGCQQKYIGMTQKIWERTYQHLGYVRNKMTSIATGAHFNLPEQHKILYTGTSKIT